MTSEVHSERCVYISRGDVGDGVSGWREDVGDVDACCLGRCACCGVELALFDGGDGELAVSWRNKSVSISLVGWTYVIDIRQS